jgi:hypothetical protein
VFIYAILKPKKKPNEKLTQDKETSVKILEQVQKGEEVITTVIHLSEVANLIETRSSLAVSVDFIKEIISIQNVKILGVSLENYIEATLLAEDKKISINDALAYLKMKEMGISEIYTFNTHFQKLDIKIIQSST